MDGIASATLTYYAKGDITILESVTIGGKQYSVVEMEKAGFTKNSRIRQVSLPNSIKIIKTGAFQGCKNLNSILLPTSPYAIEPDAFKGCMNITHVDGYILPLYTYMKDTEGFPWYVPRFSTYAETRLKQRMELWQTKKEYETLEQYQYRVTDENCRKRLDEFVEELKQEYISLYAPTSVYTELGSYDNEYEVYTIRTDFYGSVFTNVPKSDVAGFRQNYNQVKVLPQFEVRGDTLAFVSCQFKLGDKVYESATNYASIDNKSYQYELPPLDISLVAAAPTATAPTAIDDTVDKNIPKSKQENAKTFALIIGNEQYKRVAQVPFANNDARVFAEYCKKTLGLPASNVRLYLNAGLNDMRHAVATLVNTLKAYDGEAKAIVYYAGHGIPDEGSHMPYLLPVDGFATDVKSGYNLSDLYDELAAAPSQMTMVLLDACFSGAKRNGEMLADARGVALKVRSTMPTGNLLVFSASQGNETAYSDKRHGHGMFTYYLLRHLQETEGNTTVSDLTDFVISNVKRSSVSENDGKMQTPTLIPSASLMNSWQGLRLK